MKEKKTVAISIRLTQSDLDRLDELAHRAGSNRTAVLVSMIRAGRVVEVRLGSSKKK